MLTRAATLLRDHPCEQFAFLIANESANLSVVGAGPAQPPGLERCRAHAKEFRGLARIQQFELRHHHFL